jgi:hypothetical protein
MRLHFFPKSQLLHRDPAFGLAPFNVIDHRLMVGRVGGRGGLSLANSFFQMRLARGRVAIWSRLTQVG